jgi:hypothetical protein
MLGFVLQPNLRLNFNDYIRVQSSSQVMTDKPIEWVGTVKKDLMDFPDDARRQA